VLIKTKRLFAVLAGEDTLPKLFAPKMVDLSTAILMSYVGRKMKLPPIVANKRERGAKSLILWDRRKDFFLAE
jgi:hypothetical protein